MAKVVDITEKLDLEENPKLKIKDFVVEVNADAASVLKIMGTFSSIANESEAALKAYDILFSKEDRKKMEEAKLSFKDLSTIIELAIDIALGESEEESGEEVTPITT